MAKREQQKSLSALLTRDWLMEHAGKKVFERGVDYHNRKLVEIIHHAGHEIQADVTGTETYRVHITLKGRSPAASCDCPAMEDFGGICKHIVATSLTIMEGNDASVPSIDPARRRPAQQDQLESYLGKMTREDLTSLVKERAQEDRNFRRTLLRGAAAENLSDKPDALYKSFRSQITQMTYTRGFVDCWDAASWFAPVIEVIRDIEIRVLPPQPTVAADLCEYLYERLQAAIQNIDDSNGECSIALDALGPLYHQACAAAKISPEILAEKLFVQRRDNWLFRVRMEDFRPLLASSGWDHYKKTVKESYGALPQEKPKFETQGMIAVYTGTAEDNRASAIRDMMKEILETDGNIEERIAFMARNLAWPNNYTGIAELCLKHGRAGEAGQWLDKGLSAFKPPFAQDLPWRRAALHIQCQEYQKAQELLWHSFEQRGDYDAWSHVKKLSRGIPDEARRSSPRALEDRAIAWLKKGVKGADGYCHRDTLARIYLDRDASEEAWAVKKRGTVSKDLLLLIAKKTQAQKPDIAIELYRTFTEECITQTGRNFYEEAVKHLKILQGLMKNEDFSTYLTDIRARCGRKRALLEMLQKF